MGNCGPNADELQARAKANGYKRGAHKVEDAIREREKHNNKRKRDQDKTLRRYILWRLLEAMETDDAQPHGNPPTEDMLREQYLGKGVTAPDLTAIKDFVRFYIATSRLVLFDVPTDQSINTVAEWFFAGFTRHTGTDIDEEERSEVYNCVRQALVAEGLVVKGSKPKHNFYLRDLNRVLVTLWTLDDLIFIPEQYRIQFTFIVRVYC